MRNSLRGLPIRCRPNLHDRVRESSRRSAVGFSPLQAMHPKANQMSTMRDNVGETSSCAVLRQRISDPKTFQHNANAGRTKHATYKQYWSQPKLLQPNNVGCYAPDELGTKGHPSVKSDQMRCLPTQLGDGGSARERLQANSARCDNFFLLRKTKLFSLGILWG
jgi:hypothetical protein